MSETHKKLETLANVAIIISSVLFGAIVIYRYFSSYQTLQPLIDSRPHRVENNTKLPLKNIDWSRHEKNFVVVFSMTCRFCIESIEFYKQLAKLGAERDNIRIIVVTPHPVVEAREFFRDKGVNIDEIVHADLADLSINATPTLLLIDQNGKVKDSWIGKLNLEKEKTIIYQLFEDQGGL